MPSAAVHRRARPRTRTRAARSRRARAGPRRGSLEYHWRPRLHERGDACRIPVRQAHAAVRFGMPDVAGLWRAVDPVVLEAQRNPDDADRVVRPGLERGLLVGGYRIPEEI